LSWLDCVCKVNVAVTFRAWLIVTTHAPLPVQSPLHCVKDEPLPTVGVSVTGVPLLNSAEHVGGHSMPGGLLDTEPVPLPVRATVRLNETGATGVAFTSLLFAL